MKTADQIDFVADGRNRSRRAEFAAADAAAVAWQQAHPYSFDDYLNLVQTVHDLFGPFPRAHTPRPARDFFRL